MKTKKNNLSLIYKVVICIIGIISLIMTTGVLDNAFNIKAFTMFTTISNLLCVIYFTIDVIYISIKKKSNNKDIFPVLKHIVTFSITLTCVIAVLLLDLGVDFSTYFGISLFGLHYVVPIMVIIDWLIFEKKGTMKKFEPLIWLIIPIMYFILAELSAKYGSGFGIIDGDKYPYFFLDVEKLGILKVAIYAMMIGVGSLIIGYIYYFIDCKLKKSNR